MTRTSRIFAKPALVVAAALAAGVSATAIAATGGAAYGPLPAGQVGSDALHAPGATILGSWIRFSGTVSPGQRVQIQRLDAAGWTTAATATAAADGSYAAGWHSDRPGVVQIRAVPGGQAQARTAGAASSLRLRVFKPARATWFGPGFYGHRTACGQTLTRTLVGVANRALPCGTKVSLFYHGRTIRVPVVDRGPYGTGASWDLTAAAAQQLAFTGSDRLGVLAPRSR